MGMAVPRVSAKRALLSPVLTVPEEVFAPPPPGGWGRRVEPCTGLGSRPGAGAAAPTGLRGPQRSEAVGVRHLRHTTWSPGVFHPGPAEAPPWPSSPGVLEWQELGQ